ncbi:MAG: hypothetical protein IKD93_01985 [Firmicutes bacterium]|nr:hypothetical protein [Bacillota bacterium]
MAEAEVKPIAILKDGLEASLLTQVLRDEELPFQIEPNRRGLGSIMGSAFDGFARVWGRPQDEEAILAHLEDVRNSQIVDNKDYLVNGRMWRIKRS